MQHISSASERKNEDAEYSAGCCHLMPTPERRKQPEDDGVKLFKYSELQEEWLSENVSRRLVVGKNEMLGYVFIKKGGIVPAHKHVSEQISIVLKGGLKFTINGREIVVNEGEILVIPPNVEHLAVAFEDTLDLDCFSPLREDWLTGKDAYLRGNPAKAEDHRNSLRGGQRQ